MTTTRAEPTSIGWTPDDSTFGARLALIRQHMGWGNVKQAAAVCGLPAESWRTWERDNVTPRQIVQIAETIADRTGCDYGWLLAGSRLRSSGEPIPRYQPPKQPINVRPPTRTDRRRPPTRVPRFVLAPVPLAA